MFVFDVEELKRKCELLNKVGELCHKRGMRFHYHNHWHKFMTFDGKCMLELIAEYTDPELVDIELGTYWAARGGVYPVETINRYGNRITMLHQKDISIIPKDLINFFDKRDRNTPISDMKEYMEVSVGTEHDFIEVGNGIMDIQSIINAAVEENVSYITLEQDRTQLDELESVEVSLNNFKKYEHFVLMSVSSSLHLLVTIAPFFHSKAV